MRNLQYMIDSKDYFIPEDELKFTVLLFHFPYARTNEYELYRNDKLVADGKCPRDQKPDDIYKYHVRHEISSDNEQDS